MVLKFQVIVLLGVLLTTATGNDWLTLSGNLRHLLQSTKGLDLERLCSVQSEMNGAFVMFNEDLLKSLCDQSTDVCNDIPPVYANPGQVLTCKMVVEQGLCNDPYMLRSNFCAQSCKRCEGGSSCVTTIAGCKCLDEWTSTTGGQVYSGCANPDNDPKAPWCRIDTSTCIGTPNGKDIDYCDPICQETIDQQIADSERAECEAYGQECSIQCKGEENIQQVLCYGLEKTDRQCTCQGSSLKETDTTLPPTTATSTPTTTNTDLKLVNAVIDGDCYDYLPSKEHTCKERVEWGSCTEDWIAEKFFCAISCGLCDEKTSQDYDCLSDFTSCVETCDGEQNMQEFACFRDLKKSECLCSKEVKRVSSMQDDIPTDDCFDYLPESEGNCQLRKSWGSCTEEWMREKNFCALTCGFCQPAVGGNVTAVGKTAVDYEGLSRSISAPLLSQQTPAPKDPTSTLQSTSSNGQIWSVITSDADTLSVLTDVQAEMQFLEAHNAIRFAHCVQDLVWSYELALEAQLWAQQCIPSVIPTSPYGQLVYSEQASTATPSDIVQQWYTLSDIVDYSSLPPVSTKTQALYQLLWADTKSVGCASHTCENDVKVVVCAYDPKGNDPKTLEENVSGPC